jgi:hypothetical protein
MKGTVAKAPDAPAAAPEEAPPAPRRQSGPKGMTVFNPATNQRQQTVRESLTLRSRAAAVRDGDYRESPFAWSVGGPKDAGVLEEAAEGAAIQMTVANRPIQYLEAVFVHLPKGSEGAIGSQFIVYRLGSVINGDEQAVVPTGIIKLISPGANGRARAQLTYKFEDVFTGQGVTPLDTLKMPPNTYPARVEFGLATRVTWLKNDPVLPGAGHYLFIAAGQKEGIVTGDQVTVFKDRGVDSQGVQLPDEEVAVAQITRVTPWGAAAIIIKTLQAGVAAGARARITAKMP